MASLLAKDAYLQSLASKICARPSPEPHQRKSGGKAQGSEAAGPPKKKRKRAQKKPREQREKAVESKAQALGEKPRAASQARKPLAAKQERASGSSGVPADGRATESDSLFALDVLRQRLHEKIQEARGQVGGGALGGQEQRVCCSGFPLCLERRCALRGWPPALPATVGLSRISGTCGADRRGSAAPF
uniref:Surfeit 6 n=1 Tax=Myotis myotis TaxID=51298 RepID=A0A7J7URR5_MYOMY|nr:surfeit 6 [Myotis myotis]